MRLWMLLVLITAILLAAIVGWSGLTPGALPAAEAQSEMVLIPAGDFLMGSNTNGDHAPTHTVRLEAFYLDSHEVTNAEYSEFCEATGHRLPEFWGVDARRSGPEYPDHPVVGVSWQDAADYAAWRGKRCKGTPRFTQSGDTHFYALAGCI